MTTRLKTLIALTGTAAALVAAAPAGAAEIFWSAQRQIDGMNLDRSNVHYELVNPAHTVSTVSDGRHLYWSDYSTNTIERAELDGSNRTTLVTLPNPPFGIAVTRSHVYWVDYVDRKIGRARLDGSGAEPDLVTTPGVIGDTFNIAVNGTHIYWANFDTTNPGIFRARLDGSDARRVVDSGPVIFLTIDDAHVYWSRYAATGVGRATLDGADVRAPFIDTPDYGYGIAVDDRHLYWVADDRIARANVDGTGTDTAWRRLTTSPFAIGLVRPAPVADATSVDFGEAVAGSTRTVTIRNEAVRGTLRTKAVRVVGDGFAIERDTCTGAPVVAGASCEITVRFAPDALGARTGRLEVATNDFSSSPIRVALSGTAIAAPAAGDDGAQPFAGEGGTAIGRATTGSAVVAGRAEVVICRTGHKRCRTVTLTTVPRGTVRIALQRGGRTRAAVTRTLRNGRTRVVLRTSRTGAHTLRLTVPGTKTPPVLRTLRVL